jgi:hypothetical protein
VILPSVTVSSTWTGPHWVSATLPVTVVVLPVEPLDPEPLDPEPLDPEPLDPEPLLEALLEVLPDVLSLEIAAGGLAEVVADVEPS